MIEYFVEFLTAAKATLDIYKGVKGELPEEKSKQVSAELEKAEVALKKGEAELAKKLGYRLCRCEFPPPIMLWKADIRKSVCPKCGDKYPPDQKISELSTPGPWGRGR